MTTDEFWELIARATAEVGDDDDYEAERQAQLLEEHLVEKPPEDIIDFDRIFHERMHEADDWKLWGAAYIIRAIPFSATAVAGESVGAYCRRPRNLGVCNTPLRTRQ